MSETNNPVQVFSELLGGPLGDLISSVGQGVGDAQAALDEGALRQTLDIYDTDKDSERTAEDLKLIELIREMGYQPTFYAIPETEVEAQISLSLDLKSETNSPLGGYGLSKFKINATPLNAGNTNRFGLQANAMAKLKFKIVPVPPAQGTADLRPVPTLTGKSWEAGKELLDKLGFAYELRNTANEVITDDETALERMIADQLPYSGSVSRIGSTLLVYLSDIG